MHYMDGHGVFNKHTVMHSTMW